MNKVKFVIVNSIVMVLLGSILVSFAIEIVWMLVSGRDYLPIGRLVFNFFIGLIISTVVVLLHLLTMRFKKKPLIGYIFSFFIIAVLLLAVYVHTGLTTGYWLVDAKWLVIFTVVESFSIFLVVYWYRQIDIYNQKLEIKKALLRGDHAGKDVQ
ncbi:MAG: hypothetical protein N3I35_01480 [Clostridia bacterium]|nr:hypothetical protein [Clostridia bacterium]